MNEATPDSGKNPIRCVVIQLTRLGDTLQSLMALRAAKQLYPQMEITFVCRERYSAAAKRVPWIGEVVTLPTEEILGPILEGKSDEAEGIAQLAQWMGPLVKNTWDLVVNWSYSDSSSYLTGILPGKIKLGFTRHSDLSLIAADGWSHYIQAILQGRVGQNIHLTDILTTQLLTALQIHYGEPVNDGNSPVTSKNFFSLEMGAEELMISPGDLGKKWIAVQLGTGRADKTWDPENWAKVASMILSRHPDTKIVLLGGKEDQARAKLFSEELFKLFPKLDDSKALLSLVGQTDFDLWASVVGRSQWLLAGDTAGIHLASVLGTRVLNVSVGPVAWTETGPYGNGHYVIAPAATCEACVAGGAPLERHTCRTDLTPEAVYAAWAYASSEWSHRRQVPVEVHFGNLGFKSQMGKVKLFRAKIRNTNDGGGVYYEPLMANSIALTDWHSMVMGHIARSWYCGWVPPLGQELAREQLGPKLIQSLRELKDSSLVLSQILAEAQKTALALNEKGARLKSEKVMSLNERTELTDLGKKLFELDELVERLIVTQPILSGFSKMSKVLMHNLRSVQMADLGKESASCYSQLREGIEILQDWVDFTQSLAKPVVVDIKSGSARAEKLLN